MHVSIADHDEGGDGETIAEWNEDGAIAAGIDRDAIGGAGEDEFGDQHGAIHQPAHSGGASCEWDEEDWDSYADGIGEVRVEEEVADAVGFCGYTHGCSVGRGPGTRHIQSEG